MLETISLVRETAEDTELKKFWGKYLQHFEMITDSGLYRKFLCEGIKLLEIKPGMKVLEAGCGFAYWSQTLLNFLAKEEHEARDAISVVAFDYVEEVLLKAKEKVTVSSVQKIKSKKPQFQVVLGDANETLSGLADGSFDIVAANLLLPYLKYPLASLQEMVRKLKPGGQAVMTSLVPVPKLLIVVIDYVRERLLTPRGWWEIRHNLPKGWRLYKEANKIKELTRKGVFKYFAKDELAELLKQAGLVNIKVKVALAGQGIIAKGDKPSA